MTHASGFRRSAIAFSSARRSASWVRSSILASISAYRPRSRSTPSEPSLACAAVGGPSSTGGTNTGSTGAATASVSGVCGLRSRLPVLTRRGSSRRLRTAFRFRLVRLPFEDPGPVEGDVGIVLLDQPDGVLVERRTPDLDARRRPEPVKDARPPLPFALLRVDDERVLVAAFVAAEPELGQDLLPLLSFGPWRGSLLGGRLCLCVPARLSPWPRLVWVSLRRVQPVFDSAGSDRCTRVKRVWSPMVWKLHSSDRLTWFSAASLLAISTDPAGTYR